MTTRTALDADTDQALAEAACLRTSGNPVVLLLAELGDAYADLLGRQFPGDEETAARVLASAALMLGRAADDLPSTRTVPLVLGFTAEAMHRKGAGL